MLRASTKAKVFVHLFQKVADSKDSVFGRTPQSTTQGVASGHHELFEKSSTKNFWSSSTEISTYFLVYLPSFSNTVSSWVEILNSLWDAKSCPALIAFGMLVSVPAPPTHPPGQAMPSSR